MLALTHQPNSPAAWRWADDDQVLVWDDGTTIAFRAELEAVLKSLSTIGLPPLSAVVLLLAACRDSWPTSSQHLQMPELAALSDLKQDLLPALNRVAVLPRDLRESLESKVQLAAFVFEAAFEALPRFPRGLEDGALARTLETLRNQAPVVVPVLQDMTLGAIGVVRQFLLHGLEHLAPERLRLRRQTGLDQLLRPADPESEPAEQVRSLLTQLLGDEELSGLARLAQQLVAATSLPRALAGRDELPLGGVSDISNRGSLDRLLVSELAQDDLTLSVRLAMNEALYLRREVPPHEPPQHRLVVLDSGLRMWGVPRLFATATALSLAANAGRTTVSVLRSAGAQLESVDLTTRDGLLAHLAALDHSVHPGKALPMLQQLMERVVGDCLPVLITGEDVLADPEFVTALNALAWPRILLAIVSREGRLQLLQRSLNGTRLVRETQFDLSDILEPTSAPVSSLISRREDRLPAIFSVTPFPLRVPYGAPKGKSWVCGTAVVSVSPTKQLQIWERPDRGPRLLLSHVVDTVEWQQFVDSPEPLFRAVVSRFDVTERRTIYELLTVPLNDRLATRVVLRPVEMLGERVFASVGGGIAAIGPTNRTAMLFDSGGAQVTEFSLSNDMVWRRTRFFNDSTQWSVLAYDGQQFHLEPVPHTRELNQSLLGLFDPPDCDGPVGITKNGLILHTASGKTVSLGGGVTVQRINEVSPNQERVEVTLMFSDGRSAQMHVDLKTGHVMTPQSPLNRPVRPRSLRVRFNGIALTTGGALVLYASQNLRLQIQLGKGCLRLGTNSAVVVCSYQRFGKPVAVAAAGVSLQIAAWEDGSRALLDPRGLLHLRSSDPEIPEATIVLHEHDLAVWCSDGRITGPEYFFLKDCQQSSADGILSDVIGAFVRHITDGGNAASDSPRPPGERDWG